MRYAFSHGCDLAKMVAEAGGDSQRNAERKGFRIAYTRTKWRLAPMEDVEERFKFADAIGSSGLPQP